MEPRYNEPVYNEVFGITNDFLSPVIVKYMEKYLDITKPRYSERFLPVPWFCYSTTLYFGNDIVSRRLL